VLLVVELRYLDSVEIQIRRGAMVKPLDGIKVLEVTGVVAGPTAGWILGALGAALVKVESKDSRERAHRAGAPAYFVCQNRRRRSIAIDLKSHQGKQIFRRLAQQSDVLIENRGPGAMKRLGFSYDELKEVNARLICASIKGYGPGPDESKLGYDMAIQAETGLLYMTGSEDRPMRIGTSAIDMNAAVFLCLGIVLALRERDVTHKGKYVESSLFETGCFLMNYNLSETQVLGKSPSPANAVGLWWPIYDMFTTKDGKRIFVGVTTSAQWKRFCEEFDLEELLGERFSTHDKRMKERPYIIPLVTKLVSSFPREELLEKLEKAQVVCSRVNTPLEALEHPQLKAANKMCQISYPQLAKPIMAPAIPLSMEDFTESTTATAPELGEHTEEILLELGYTQNEIDQMVLEGVVQKALERSSQKGRTLSYSNEGV